MTTIEQRLREIEERASKASPGPWRAIREASADETACGYDLYSLDGPTWLEEGDYAYLARNDAEFAAHAREDIPWLLSLLREREKQMERYLDALVEIRDYAWDRADLSPDATHMLDLADAALRGEQPGIWDSGTDRRDGGD